MLKSFRPDVIILIILTAVVTVLVLNATSDRVPVLDTEVGLTEETVVEWGGAGLGAGLAEADDESAPADVEADEDEDSAADEAEEAEATEEPDDE